MRSSFNDYSEVYAETQNQQMLLNLARLHEGFPIYFFQLGQISASYTFTETGAAGGTKSSSQVGSATPTNLLSGTFSLGETVTHNPIFTLVPLAGDKFAQQLLQPINPVIFEQNFEQGWPVDQLMRILVERIEITDTGNGTTKIFENNPEDGTNGYTVGYDHFLRACALALMCQKAGVLHLVHTESFEPMVTVPEKDSAAGARDATSGAKDSSVTDAINADKDGLVFQSTVQSVKNADGTSSNTTVWQLGKNVEHSTFEFDQTEKMNALTTAIATQAPYSKIPDSIRIFQDVVASGFSLSDKSKPTNVNGPSDKPIQVQFVMRSLMGVITALATEQQAFEERARIFAAEKTADPLQDLVPAEEWRPLLTLTWPDNRSPEKVVTALNFQGQRYAIGDLPAAGGSTDDWNRDVFRMLVQLSFQVTTDAATLSTTPVVQIRGN